MLQCNHRIARKDNALHLLAKHYQDVDNSKVRQHIKAFFGKEYNRDWLFRVSSRYLGFKGVSVDQYLVDLCKPKSTLDILGILVVARVYKWQIAVVMKDWTWTTGRNLFASDCDIVFFYAGEGVFFDTQPLPEELASKFRKPLSKTDFETSKKYQEEALQILCQNSVISLEEKERCEESCQQFQDMLQLDTIQQEPLEKDTLMFPQLGMSPMRNASSDDDSSSLDLNANSSKGFPSPKRPIYSADSDSDSGIENSPKKTETETEKPIDLSLKESDQELNNEQQDLSREHSRDNSPAASDRSRSTSPASKQHENSPAASPRSRSISPAAKQTSRENSPAASPGSRSQTPPQTPPRSPEKEEAADKSTEHKGESANPLGIESANANANQLRIDSPTPGKTAVIKLNRIDLKRKKNDSVESESSSGSSTERLSSASVKRSRKAAPKKLEEQDPIGDHLSSASEIENNGHSDHESDYDEQKENIKTENGSLDLEFHGILKREKAMKPVKCSVCSIEKRSIRKMNAHMKTEHPDYKYVCETCERPFDTYNAWYKHSEHHFELRYSCKHCGQKFQFPYQYRNHVKIHTKKGLIPCTWPKCKKLFTCNKNMFQHLQAHNEQTWDCELCDPKKVFQTVSNFKQHQKGFHGDGFKSPCGKTHKWPYLRNKHNKECETCIEKLKSEKPPNPRFTKK